MSFELPDLGETLAKYATLRVPPGRIVCVEHEALDRAHRSTLGVLAPVMYQMTGAAQDYDRLFLGRVVAEGLPRVANQRTEPLGVSTNDIILASLYNLGYRFTRDRQRHYRLDARHVCGTLDPDTFAVTPVGAYLTVVPDEDAAQASMNRGGRIWLSDQERERTDDIQNEQGIKAEYGRVVELGPGTWQEGEWIDPADYCQVGDLVLFDKSFHTLPLRVAGKRLQLVECRQVIMAERDQPTEEQCKNDQNRELREHLLDASAYASRPSSSPVAGERLSAPSPQPAPE